MEFCEFIKVRDNFSNDIVFSDKARFELHGNVNDNAEQLNFVNSHLKKYLNQNEFHCSILKKSRCL